MENRAFRNRLFQDRASPATRAHEAFAARNALSLSIVCVMGIMKRVREMASRLRILRVNMATAYRVLVANENPVQLGVLTKLLASAGYDAVPASTFEEARTELDATPPDLLIAHLRLGAFNGLHLVLRGRADGLEMASIITTGPEDHSLKSEVMEHGVLCVPTPLMTTDFLTMVAKAIERRGSPAWH
jgi:PleD family two-component response regulator